MPKVKSTVKYARRIKVGDVLLGSKALGLRLDRAKAVRNRIERAYYAACDGVQVNVMDIPKIFAVGEQAIAEGADDAALQTAIFDFVQTIRTN